MIIFLNSIVRIILEKMASQLSRMPLRCSDVQQVGVALAAFADMKPMHFPPCLSVFFQKSELNKIQKNMVQLLLKISVARDLKPALAPAGADFLFLRFTLIDLQIVRGEPHPFFRKSSCFLFYHKHLATSDAYNGQVASFLETACVQCVGEIIVDMTCLVRKMPPHWLWCFLSRDAHLFSSLQTCNFSKSPSEKTSPSTSTIKVSAQAILNHRSANLQ